AIAGGTGTRSRGRSLARTEILAGRLLALANSMSRRAALLEYWIVTLDSDSAPPASTTSTSPLRIASAPKAMARLEEAQARLTVVPGMFIGRPARKTTS